VCSQKNLKKSLDHHCVMGSSETDIFKLKIKLTPRRHDIHYDDTQQSDMYIQQNSIQKNC
jgi:hypothetical protein